MFRHGWYHHQVPKHVAVLYVFLNVFYEVRNLVYVLTVRIYTQKSTENISETPKIYVLDEENLISERSPFYGLWSP